MLASRGGVAAHSADGAVSSRITAHCSQGRLVDRPEETLRDLKTFLAHLILYGSPAGVAAVERYVPVEEFRKVLEDAPAGLFTRDAWQRWHERLGILPVPPLPRRRFPDGTLGPRPGHLLRPMTDAYDPRMSNGQGYSARHLEHSDYYAEGERAIGQWRGQVRICSGSRER